MAIAFLHGSPQKRLKKTKNKGARLKGFCDLLRDAWQESDGHWLLPYGSESHDGVCAQGCSVEKCVSLKFSEKIIP
jgi:hypothetical protein